MKSTTAMPAYRPLGAALLRTTVHARESDCGAWPGDERSLDGAARAWRRWLIDVWSQPRVASAVRVASPGLAGRLDALSAGADVSARQIRRMTFALARYMVRMRHRATPFGLFAGVAVIQFGSSTAVDWSEEHRPVSGADARWLASIIARLEACPRLRSQLRVTANNLVEVRGQRLLFGGQPHATETGQRIAGEFSIQRNPAVRAIMELAVAPIFVWELQDKLACEYPDVPMVEFDGLLTELMTRGVLVSELRPPSTCTDGLGHVLERLDAMPADAVESVRHLIGQLREVQHRLAASTSFPHGFDEASHRALTTCMTELSDATEQPVTVDLRLGATATLPPTVGAEAAAAAEVLVRLSPAPSGVKAWREYHGAFLATYGPGALVPVEQLTSAAGGIDFPRHFHEQPQPPGVSGRDEQLLALAHQAVMDGTREIVLDAATLGSLAPEGTGQGFPHVDVWFDLRAASAAALDAGDFTVAVCGIGRPGAAVGRFVNVLPDAGGDLLTAEYRSLPAVVDGALPVQLSFPPRTVAAENVLRAQLIWPEVISLGEHHPDESNRIPVSELAVTADQHRMHLVSLSRRRVLEPHIPHAAARHAMPLLARFLFEVPRATGPAVSSFDWGIAARLPFLPRVRYGRATLAPAQWRLAPADLPGRETPQPEWDAALAALRKRRGLPAAVSVGNTDRQLRLHLDAAMDLALLREHMNSSTTAVTLFEAATAAEHGWLESRAHEIVLPLAATHPPAKPPAFLTSSAPLPLGGGEHAETPGADGSVFNATIYGPADAVDEILLDHLPGLWAPWGEERPLWWFIRYRTPQPQLRLRIRHPDYGRVAERVGRWVQELREARLVNRVSFDAYYPEIGRYGPGASMDAAEELFTADSKVVLAQLAVHAASRAVHPHALTAASMVDLACAMIGGRAAGMRWLLEQPQQDRHTPIRDRAMLRQAQRFAEESALDDLPHGSQVVEAWRARTSTAHAYTTSLTSGVTHLRPASVLPSLLHLHHVRAHGIDPDAEAITHRLAHSIALSWNARHAQNSEARS